ncbi:Hypothetical protein D9617_7g030390 [Elsinoe fawcettii]|nr:Hypothetical protein D9617_7g030390 [Elsinoe fawcettii]
MGYVERVTGYPERSQTPKEVNVEMAQRRVSRLSLDESPKLSGKPSDLAALIRRTNTSSPSKKRPASSSMEKFRHRSSAPRSIFRQLAQGLAPVSTTSTINTSKTDSGRDEGIEKAGLKRFGKPRSQSACTIVAPGRINSMPINALADSGSTINTIDAEFARWIGLRMSRLPLAQIPTIKTFTGRVIRCRHVVQARWTFEDGRSMPETIFFVIDKSPYPVILGKPFLQSSGSWAQPHGRLFRDQSSASNRRPLGAYLQSDADHALPRFTFDWFGTPVTALADTGCQTNIMSLAFAEANGLAIDRHNGSRTGLRMADGQFIRSYGRVFLPPSFLGDLLAEGKLDHLAELLRDRHDMVEDFLHTHEPLDLDDDLIVFAVLQKSSFDLVLGADLVIKIGLDKLDSPDGEDLDGTLRVHHLNAIDVSRRQKLARCAGWFKRASAVSLGVLDPNGPGREEKAKREELHRRALAAQTTLLQPQADCSQSSPGQHTTQVSAAGDPGAATPPELQVPETISPSNCGSSSGANRGGISTLSIASRNATPPSLTWSRVSSVDSTMCGSNTSLSVSLCVQSLPDQTLAGRDFS